MKIKTAHDLGFDAVEGLLHDRRLSRRILALAASRIQVSEGVLELMREGSREKQLLTALFLFEAEAADERDLERIGEHLDQASLEQLLVARALYIFPTECGAKGFTLSTPWSEIRKGLGFDLPLNVKVEDDSAPLESPPSTDNDDDVIDAQIVNKLVIISTKDEIKVEAGSSIVLHHGALDRRRVLDDENVQSRIDVMVEEKAIAQIGLLYDLPSLADADEFEKTLLSLSFALKGTRYHNELIKRATQTFADRPRRTRKVIAEVMKRYGLNATLMENIVFLCEDNRSVPLQIEAINMVVKGLTAKNDPIELLMAATTLILVLYEDAKLEIQRRAIACLAEKAGIIALRLPRFLEDARAIPIMKTLLISSPEEFRGPVEKLLLSFGVMDSAPIEEALKEDLDTITNPFVLMTFYQALEAFTSDLLAQREWAENRWRLALTEREAHPQLLIECEERFKNELPASLDTLCNIMHKFRETERVYFIELLDQSFAGALARNDAETIRCIAKYFFDQLITEDVSGIVEIAILKTATILSPQLGEKYSQAIWPKMLSRFTVLAEDEQFVQRFVAAGRVLFAEAAVTLFRTDTAMRLLLTPLCYKKIEAIKTDERKFEEHRPALLVALQRLSKITVHFLIKSMPPFSFGDLFDGIGAIMASPLATSEMLHDLAVAAISACTEKRLTNELETAYRLVRENSLFDEQTLTLFTQAFVQHIAFTPHIAFAGIRQTCQHQAMSEGLFLTTFIELIKASKPYQQYLLETEVALATCSCLNPGTMSDIITHMVELFLGILSAPANIPKPPTPDGFAPTVPPLANTALTGVLNLNEGRKLSAMQVAGCKHQLTKLVADRPPKVMTPFQKDNPSREVPDRYKQVLQAALEQL
ncbi:MAG: hypothetical protein UT32_C0014G0017 [Parcubacteria group bacterium GW2011_GWC2_39_14]|nr:MAG: hypothetical protein UT32_C0014G0017 [Parcubacteria group bacterium GW2011_GWC2_39_14]KKR54465.1 MAG: hypothetical protein UT91_C0015G0017 [Parcubacteria group bacterium GW2011_GWA2_40_23]